MISSFRPCIRSAASGVGLFAFAAIASAQIAASTAVTILQTRNSLVMSNGYIRLAFDLAAHRMVQIDADHTGAGDFHNNLLEANGIRFDDSAEGPQTLAAATVMSHSPRRATVRLSWPGDTSGREVLTLRLTSAERGVEITVDCPSSARTCGDVSMSLRQWFLLGIFQRGVMQYIAGQGQSFTSRNPLRVFYTMDRDNGSIAIVPEDPAGIAETTLVSSSDAHVTGIELHPRQTAATADKWIALTKSAPVIEKDSPFDSHTMRFRLYANDLPYPVFHPENKIVNEDSPQSRDSQAYFTGVYGSAAGVLGSYLEPGSGYPTLSTPKRAYGSGFDFFDPDSWEIVTTLSYSGDPLLQNEARKILERSEAGMLPDGQIPHHFQDGVPVYLSIAKSKQTGPNLFWTLAALEYAAATGNEAWLREHYVDLQKATEWILKQFDAREQLLNVEGPLFIDVFKRSGYTLDTNAVAILLMERMSDAAAFCHDPASQTRYLDYARRIKAGLNQHLWNGSDHFITQVNPDGTRRDMVDYDGNFAALAFGVVDDRATEQKILYRLDSGPHTHPGGRGTWVSEKYYGKNDCYGGNTGDSNVAMGRIWWLDSLTRVRLGDHAMFDNLLDNMEGDLLRETWMYERYNASGGPAHNPYYHEYPEIISMVLREQRYGVHLGMHEVRIDPFGLKRFQMHLGTLQVDYSPEDISLEIPGSSERIFAIGGLPADARYMLPGHRVASTDANGWLHFEAKAGTYLNIRAANAR
jgi:hypothetical protein